MAPEELHHEIEDAVVALAEVVDVDDVGLVEAAREARLAQEPLRDRAHGRELRMDDLDRDLAIDRHLPRAVHRAHPAFAEHRTELVAMIEDATEQLVGCRPQLHEFRSVVRAEHLVERERLIARDAVSLVTLGLGEVRVGARRRLGLDHDLGSIVMVSPGARPSENTNKNRLASSRCATPTGFMPAGDRASAAWLAPPRSTETTNPGGRATPIGA